MILEFVNDNGSRLRVSQRDTPIKLCDWDFGEISEQTMESNIPYSHGTIYQGMSLNSRDCNFTLWSMERNRQSVIDALNPLSELTMIHNNTLFARGKVIGKPNLGKYTQGFVTFTVRMFEPFWHDNERVYSFNSTQTIINQGDAPTPVKVTFYGNTTVSPKLTNTTTGDAIEFNLTLASGDVINVDTAITAETITKTISGVTSDAFGDFTFESVMLHLPKGVNVLTSNCSVDIAVQNKYLEVMR